MGCPRALPLEKPTFLIRSNQRVIIMVSEARKPIVMSMAFLALFSAIIIGVGTYMIINNLKDAKVSLLAPAESKTDPMTPSTGKNKNTLAKIKKVTKKLMLFNRATKSSRAFSKEELNEYVKLLDQLDEGKLTYSPDTLLERFERDFYLSSNEALREDSKNYLSNIMDISEVALRPPDHRPDSIKIYSLKKAFGVSGSKGKLLFFDSTGSAAAINFKRLKTAQNSIARLGLKVQFDQVMSVNGKICHVVVASTEAGNENFTEANIEVVTEKLLDDHDNLTVESINALNFPTKFALFVGVSPEESGCTKPTLKEIDGGYGFKIGNVFSDADLKALFISGGTVQPEPKDFISREHYVSFLKERGLEFIDSIRLFNSESAFTIIFGTRSRDSTKLLRLNIEKAAWLLLKRVSGFKDVTFSSDAELQQLVRNLDNMAVMIVVSSQVESMNIIFESDFNWEQLVRAETIKYLTFNSRYAKFFKVYRTENEITTPKGYRFSYSSSNALEGSVGPAEILNMDGIGLAVRVIGSIDKEWIDSFVTTLKKQADEAKIQEYWFNECQRAPFKGDVSIQITLM